MPPVNITGTIQDAAGNGVVGVAIELSPAAPDPGGEEAIGGIAILSAPVQFLTDASGNFVVTALQGFRYRMVIEAIGYDRTFRAPEIATVAFHLLGLQPEIETAVDFESCEVPPVSQVKLTVKAADEAIVRERFDEIRVERAGAQGGPYTEFLTVELVPGTTFYETIVDEPVTDWFRVRYSKADNSDQSAYGDPVPGPAPDEDLVWSVDELKEQYLFGVDLTDDEGNPYPDRMFRNYIASAVAWLEKELDIDIVAKEYVNELHDHYAYDYGRWGYFQLRHYPIVIPEGTDPGAPFGPSNPSPVQVKFQYPSQQEFVDIMEEWLVLPERGEPGVLQIVPGQGNIADVLLIPGALFPLWSGATGRVPGVWRMTYKAGFCPGDIPADIRDAIGMKAAIQIFNIAGDLIAGAGIANTSISVPGLSQTVGTTSSATNSGYGARIGQYEKQLKEMLPNLKRYYGKGSKMVVV